MTGLKSGKNSPQKTFKGEKMGETMSRTKEEDSCATDVVYTEQNNKIKYIINNPYDKMVYIM